MGEQWTPEAARERLDAAEDARRRLDNTPRDVLGSGAEWAKREGDRMALYSQEKSYLYGHARSDLDHALNALTAANQRAGELEAALWLIRNHYGQVCPEFEICEHVACQASVGAWMEADRALTPGMYEEEPPDHICGPDCERAAAATPAPPAGRRSEMGMTPEQFVRLLSFMQEHGSSVDLNWGEDTNRWECAWITGGLRYIGHAETAVEAAREAYYNARAGAVARTTGEKP